MTYIGIRRRESRPLEPKGSQTQKSGRVRRKEDEEKKESIVDWKLIVEISLLLSFFSLLDKSDKERREEGA